MLEGPPSAAQPGKHHVRPVRHYDVLRDVAVETSRLDVL